MRRFTTLFSTCLWLCLGYATEPAFHKVDVREGEGVYALLRRYGLSDEVSIDKFYELNEMEQDGHLMAGKDYYLPILIYQYDGRSIRSTIGIDDWDLASRIAAFNRSMQEKGLRKSSYQESAILWVPFFEINSRGKTTAATKTVTEVAGEKSEDKPTEKPADNPNVVMEFPIFGESSKVSIKSQKLKNKVFYIVSGHGGPDPGAMAEVAGHTLCEDEYAYDVSLRLAKNLMEHGAIVELVVQDPNDGIRSERYLKCDKDERTLDNKQMPINQRLRLQQRVHLVNNMQKQYNAEGFRDQTVVCIHVDSQVPSTRQDVYFYYCEESEGGKKLALSLQETFRNKYSEHRNGRGYSGTVSCRSLYELRNTDPKAVYIELANIQNAADLKRILPEDNRQAVANWLCEGLIAAQ
jgi:N-acetylmuramoyl-L-alanine amidase